MVNTELQYLPYFLFDYYNILNIVVNTEHNIALNKNSAYYNILNIVVNTERNTTCFDVEQDYNILNIVVNTELILVTIEKNLIITY